jgi:hypothetical protein
MLGGTRVLFYRLSKPFIVAQAGGLVERGLGRQSSAVELLEDVGKAGGIVIRQRAEQLALGFAVDAGAFLVGLPPGIGDDGQARSTIAGIGLARDQAVCLETIDELRDVRFHAREPVGELTQRQRAARGLHQPVEGCQLG